MNHSFNVQLACIYGERCAILIQHFDYWLTKNKAEKHQYYFHEGTYWTRCSLAGLHEIFPYINEQQLKRVVKKLQQKNVIRVGKFDQEKSNRTNWYTFTEEFLNSPCGAWVQFALFPHSSKTTNGENRAKPGSQDTQKQQKSSSTPANSQSSKTTNGRSKMTNDPYVEKYVEKEKEDVKKPPPQKNFSQEELWEQVLAQLEPRINRPSFNTWLRPTTLLSTQDGTWRIGVPDEVFLYWLQEYYSEVLQEVISTQAGFTPEVEFVVCPHNE